MYKAKDIADYIVWLTKKRPNIGKITNLKLQKLLYFLQAYFLCEAGHPLFEDAIEKWKYGPVVPNVYHEYKDFGAKLIDDVPDEFIVDFDKGKFIKQPFDINKSLVSDDDKTRLEPVIRRLINNYNEWQLVDITHSQPMWNKDKQKILGGIRDIKYDLNEIQNYFTNNREARVWRND